MLVGPTVDSFEHVIVRLPPINAARRAPTSARSKVEVPKDEVTITVLEHPLFDAHRYWRRFRQGLEAGVGRWCCC